MADFAHNQQLELLRKRFRERMVDLADSIALGQCHTFEDYKYHTGRLAAMSEFETLLLELDLQLLKGDDKDEND